MNDSNGNDIEFKNSTVSENFSQSISTSGMSCTPYSMKCSVKSNSSVTPQKCANPFKIDLDDLRSSHLSPNVFSANLKSSNEKNKSFRWSIDQLADLKPVDIDESSHQDVHGDESESEELVQTAIDEFFSKNQVAPSPWTSTSKMETSAPKSHQVTFSPNLASTAYYDRYEDFLDSSEKLKHHSSVQDACTQTVLTIPSDINLEEILCQYYTFTERQQKNSNNVDLCISDDSRDTFSNSSLRRKLFDYIDESRGKRDERFLYNPEKFVYQKSPPLSPVSMKTPPRQKINTPGSSSPITPSNERKLSGDFSSTNMLSPAMSPIQKPVFKTPKTGSTRYKGKVQISTSSNKSDCTPKRKVILSFQNMLTKNFDEFGNVSGINVADETASNSSSSNMSTSICDADNRINLTNQYEHLLETQKTAHHTNYLNICSTRIHSNSTEDLMEYSEQNSFMRDHDTGYQSNTQTVSVNDISLSRLNVYPKSKTTSKDSNNKLRSRIDSDYQKTLPKSNAKE